MNADEICDEEYAQAQRLFRAMNAPIEDDPITTPEGTISATRLALIAIGWLAVVGFVAWVIYAAWPLFGVL
jgi:hypothetical protein